MRRGWHPSAPAKHHSATALPAQFGLTPNQNNQPLAGERPDHGHLVLGPGPDQRTPAIRASAGNGAANPPRRRRVLRTPSTTRRRPSHCPIGHRQSQEATSPGVRGQLRGFAQPTERCCHSTNGRFGRDQAVRADRVEGDRHASHCSGVGLVSQPWYWPSDRRAPCNGSSGRWATHRLPTSRSRAVQRQPPPRRPRCRRRGPRASWSILGARDGRW